MFTLSTADRSFPQLRVGDSVRVGNKMCDIVRKTSDRTNDLIPWPWWKYYTTPIRQFFVRNYYRVKRLCQRDQ